jgi:hypothetical protein
MASKRLARNRKLHQVLVDGLRLRKIKHPDASPSDTTALTMPIDNQSFRRLFALITKGLVWHHWRIVLGTGTLVRAEPISDSWSRVYGLFFTMKGVNRVKVDLGEGTFCYEGLQAEEPQELSLWRFSIYGGVCLARQGTSSNAISTQVLAITGPSNVLQKFEPLFFGSSRA